MIYDFLTIYSSLLKSKNISLLCANFLFHKPYNKYYIKALNQIRESIVSRFSLLTFIYFPNFFPYPLHMFQTVSYLREYMKKLFAFERTNRYRAKIVWYLQHQRIPIQVIRNLYEKRNICNVFKALEVQFHHNCIFSIFFSVFYFSTFFLLFIFRILHLPYL